MMSSSSLAREVSRLSRASANLQPIIAQRDGDVLTRRWYPLRQIAAQRAYWFSPHRFNTLPCGRRSGKTELFKRKLVKRALVGTRFDNPRFFAAAPTRDQAKRIYWEDLKALVPPWAVAMVSESDLMILLINGASIWVVGMDRPERVEGQPWDGGGLDEYANMKEKTWREHVRPALADRAGWCDFVGVPEGRNHYYDLDRAAKAKMLELGDASDWGSFHWRSDEVLPAEEIAAAKDDLDEMTFEQEYGGSFVTFQGRAYYTFNEAEHCCRLFDHYDPDAPLVFCFDFNVAPGVAAVGQEMRLPNGQFGTGWIGEVWIPTGSNTPAVCRRLLADWRDHRGPVHCYGDATGGAEGTAKTQGSDWELVTSILADGDGAAGLAGFGKSRVSLRVPSSNPPVRARVNAVNSRLRSTSGIVRMMVDPSRAPHLQKDFEGVRVLDGGSGEIDKKSDHKLTHISDAVGYYVAKEFPVGGDTFSVFRFKPK